MAKRRKRFTATQRQEILDAAHKGSLTAKQVKAKFGVSMVTYYLWRRKAGLTPSGGAGVGMTLSGRVASTQGLEQMIRGEVRQRIRAQLPAIVRDEVKHYLDTVLAGHAAGRSRKQA